MNIKHFLTIISRRSKFCYSFNLTFSTTECSSYAFNAYHFCLHWAQKQGKYAIF